MKIEEYNGVYYYIAKTAQENWDLLDKSKIINSNYIWFHLNSFPSCYVIMYDTLKNLKDKYNEIDVELYLHYGAQLCKNNTKYRNLKNLKIIYTTLNKLSKSDKIGEVIISGKSNTITV